jgi:acetate kinase
MGLVSGAVLVLNCGSSSIKHQLLDPLEGTRLASGILERIGEAGSVAVHTSGGRTERDVRPLATHEDALAAIVEAYEAHGTGLTAAGVVAVGHRVVMGGREFAGPARIDDHVMEAIEALSPLAPLHNSANLAGIRVARRLLPDVPHVAVFDTAFFHDLPDVAATYAIDRGMAETHGIRRYGFHGTSHRYVSEQVASILDRPGDDLRQVVLHLGNGASASAVLGGRPIDTSMGMTPLEGLVMGTRSGDLDPAVVVHLLRRGLTVDEVDDLLNRRSGMLGLAGDNDLREVHRRADAGDAAAEQALAIYVHRLRKYVGAYAALLGGLDALTFTAGVGEHDPVVRARTCDGLGFLGITADPVRNAARGGGARVISPDGSPVAVLVVPTDEELAIARDTISSLG